MKNFKRAVKLLLVDWAEKKMESNIEGKIKYMIDLSYFFIAISNGFNQELANN